MTQECPKVIRKYYIALQSVIARLLLVLLIAFPAQAHSPWGQYQVYRQKHLLIMSAIPDAPTYPYSKKLVAAINAVLPEAQARPARAKDFERVHNLLKSKQINLVLLSKENAKALVEGSGPFSAYGPTAAKTLYAFGELLLLVQPEFPDNHVWLLTNAIQKARDLLPDALPPKEVATLPNLHPGTVMVLRGDPMPR